MWQPTWGPAITVPVADAAGSPAWWLLPGETQDGKETGGTAGGQRGGEALPPLPAAPPQAVGHGVRSKIRASPPALLLQMPQHGQVSASACLQEARPSPLAFTRVVFISVFSLSHCAEPRVWGGEAVLYKSN